LRAVSSGRAMVFAGRAVGTRNILAVVDHAGERGFDRVDGMGAGLILGFAERCYNRQLWAGDKERVVVVRGEFDPVAEHHFNPN
jgi:hypothetical protein